MPQQRGTGVNSLIPIPTSERKHFFTACSHLTHSQLVPSGLTIKASAGELSPTCSQLFLARVDPFQGDAVRHSELTVRPFRASFYTTYKKNIYTYTTTQEK